MDCGERAATDIRAGASALLGRGWWDMKQKEGQCE